MDSEINQLADAIFWERVKRARKVPPSKRMGIGSQLFLEACARMRSGIRAQFPDADESEVERILRQRLARIAQLEDRGLYQPAPRNSDDAGK